MYKTASLVDFAVCIGNLCLFVSQVHIRKVETTYTESSVPVNCASEMRKRPPSICTSTRGNVMQKAKVLLEKLKIKLTNFNLQYHIYCKYSVLLSFQL